MALYIVPTPIGNLQDITLRALEILKNVDFLICEDSRHSLKLLNHYGIRKRIVSYYQPREREQAARIIPMLKGQDGALVTDSGTPLVSDPGYILIREALENGIPVSPLPGPAAFVTAIVASGLPPSSFSFFGFPPRREGKVRRLLQRCAELEHPLIFYENALRVEKLLASAAAVFPGGRFVIARELTKINETFHRARLAEYGDLIAREPLRGECVVIIHPLP